MNLKRRLTKLRHKFRKPILKSKGYCPICRSDSRFEAYDPWLRDHFLCKLCHSIPRERALMTVIDQRVPNWNELIIHESSPVMRGASKRLATDSAHYIPSQFFPDHSLGEIVDGVRCENLELLTFEDNSIDLHITQDVLEHVFRPDKVFAEIARTLRPGGFHIFTVPLVYRGSKTRCRAMLENDGAISFLHPPEYHGNPISSEGSLVTHDWGDDLCSRILDASGLFTETYIIDDLSRGIRADYIDVFVTHKAN